MHLNQFKLLDRTDVQSLYIAHGIVSVLKIFVWLNNPRGQCDLYVFRDWCPLELCSHSSLSVRAALQVDILSTHWWSFPQSHNDETQERFGKNGGLEQGFLNFNVHMTTPPPGILSKCRFCFLGFRMGPEILLPRMQLSLVQGPHCVVRL